MITVLEIPHRLPPRAYQLENIDALIDLAAGAWHTYDKQEFIDCWGDEAPAEAMELLEKHDNIVELDSSGDTSYVAQSLFDELEAAKDVLFHDLQKVYVLYDEKELVEFYREEIQKTPHCHLRHKLDEFIGVHLYSKRYTHQFIGSGPNIDYYAELIDINNVLLCPYNWNKEHSPDEGWESEGVLSLDEARNRLEISGEDGGFSPSEKEQVMLTLGVS
tara:strand:+ start:803 stop:1456 length:654 start_codon:yes stop_codon:yes gene_type:complete